MKLFNQQSHLAPQLTSKTNEGGFSSNEMIVVLASIGILATMSIPILIPFVEMTEVLIAEKYLLGAVRACQMGLLNDEAYPTYTLPPQEVGLGLVNTRRFRFPDTGNDGECLSPVSGNILAASRTNDTQLIPTYRLNINVITGEKSTDGDVPKWLDWWEGIYSPLIPEGDPLLP